MKRLFKKLFNFNTGLFINEVTYFHSPDATYYTGYVVCQGFVLFGIPGYDRVGHFVDKEDAVEHMEAWSSSSN